MRLDEITRNATKSTIRPSSGFRTPDFAELWRYRDLFYFMVWRDLKVRYAQSVLGVGWAVVQPVFYMVVFTVVFGNLAEVGSDGVPYAIFSFAGLVPWTFFSNALTGASSSLVNSKNMISKVYFPRVIMPLAAVLGKLIDLGIALVVMGLLMAWFRTAPTVWAALIPVLALIAVLAASGLGMLLTALAVQYRDVNYGMNFLVQLLMYGSPVVYPASLIPEQYRLLYALNPMVGVIEGFRSALIGTNPMPWDLIAVGSLSAIALTAVGLLYFHRAERIFADVA